MSRLTLTKLIPQGRGLAAALVKRAATVELDWAARRQSRFDATDALGRTLVVDLPAGSVLRGGDVLVAEDGSLLRVLAAAQPVLQVTACASHGSPADLLRAAYRLGARHVALELQPERLQLEPDAALAELLRAMHLSVGEAHAPFEPEADADAAGGHAHAHAQGHPHAAARGKPVGIAVAAAPHVHGPGCGHGHGHSH
ncbi:MAG TPA: urease accessory protein UreE [Methylibium sp.]|nr:urease accessory protein UreE [Methylibium sp.]